MRSNDDLIDALLADPTYLVRPDGTVWRYWPGSPGRHGERWKKSATRARHGYWLTSYAGVPLYVHRVVYRRFHGPLIEGLVVQHLDNNKQNCRPENLEQVSSAVNAANSPRPGILSARQVEAIRLQPHRSKLSLAKEYGVARDTISRCYR